MCDVTMTDRLSETLPRLIKLLESQQELPVKCRHHVGHLHVSTAFEPEPVGCRVEDPSA